MLRSELRAMMTGSTAVLLPSSRHLVAPVRGTQLFAIKVVGVYIKLCWTADADLLFDVG